jgi:hypothetical protein
MRSGTCLGLAAGLIALLAAGGAEAADCPAKGATYRMEGTDRFEITLAPLAQPTAWSDLGLTLSDRTTGATWRFGLTASNGYGLESLVPDFELPEEAALHVFFFAAEEGYAGPARMPLPSASGAAPDLVFAPELGVTFWYDLPERVDLPTEMWVRTACGRP